VRHLARYTAVLPTAILLITNVAFAQRSASGGGTSNPRFEISGTISEEEGHSPIAGAQVKLSTGNGQMLTMTYSNVNGQFTFLNLSGGRYALTITAEGFQTGQQDISLISNSSDNVRIMLERAANPKKDNTGKKEDLVSARELSLPAKAQESLAKARERLFQKHDPAGSLPLFRKVNELAPSFYEAYYEEGIAYTIEGQNGDAESSFRKAIAASQDHYSDPCFALASLLTDEKNFPEAERLARRGIEIQPDAWRGQYELARALLGEGRLVDAENSAVEARKRKDDFPGLYLILANIHLQLHKNEAVLDDVNTFLKLDPSGPNSEQARAIKGQMEHALGKSPGSDPL
jgi:tetratricopeptide (TPR) repeat protein